MKKRIVKTFAAALVAFGATLFARADPAQGSIYSIDLVEDKLYGGIVPTEANPLRIGQKAVIRVRLLNSNWADPERTGSPRPWSFEPTVAAGETIQSTMSPKLGLMLGGKPVYADLIEVKDDVTTPASTYTDIYFSYVVQSGDLAMPAHLMNAAGQPASSTVSADYALLNKNLWKLTNADGEEAVFHFYDGGIDPPAITGQPQNKCVSGLGMGLYMKTVDFDKNYAKEAETTAEKPIWRQIYRGMVTTTVYGLPTVAVEGQAENPTTLYVWVDKGEGGVTVAEPLATDGAYEVTDADGGKRVVLPVSVPKGVSVVSFKLKGLVNGKATVKMSSTEKLVFDDMNQLVTNWVERVVQVIDPPDPFVAIDLQDISGKALEKSTITLTPNYENYSAMMTLTLSQDPSADLTVTLVPELADGDIFTDGLLGISETTDGSPWLGENLTFTFKPGGSLSKTLYVYGKGTTAKLSTAGVKFTVTTSGAPEYDAESGKHYANLIVKHMAPLVVKPTSADSIENAMAGQSYPLDLTISDARKWMLDATDGTSFYKFYYKVAIVGDDSSAWSDPEELALDDADTGAATVSIPFDIDGEGTLQIYVVSPSGKQSAKVQIPVKVAAPKKAWATLDREAGSYAEGETAKVKFFISQKYKSALWAFLVPLDDDARNKFLTTASSEYAGGIGCYIAPGDLESKDYVEVEVKDGKASGQYEVYMCTQKTYSPVKSGGYVAGSFTINATNVVPRINYAEMGGQAVKVNGGAIAKAIAQGVEKTFRVNVDEPGLLDLTATGDDEFVTAWKFGTGEWEEMRGNPSTATIKHTFSSPGTHEVTVRCQDKDMRALNKWSEEFMFHVTVLDIPKVVITPIQDTKTYYEDQTGSDYGFNVSLTAAPDLADSSKRLNLALTVTDLSTGATASTALIELSKYFVTYASGVNEGQTFFLSALDGTAKSAAKGYRITATVTNPEIDTEGKTWDPGELEIYIVNRAPQILNPAEKLDKEGEPIASTTTIGTENSLTWAVKDVTSDEKLMSVTWETSEGKRVTYHQGTGVDTDTDKYVDDVMSGTHVFKFTSAGEKSITMTVQDKDGETDSRTFYYTISASKTLKLIPHGPTAGKGTPLSKRYRAAKGIGEGRVFAKNISSLEGFEALYNCGLSKSWTIYAYGYKVGETSGNVVKYPTRENPVDANGDSNPAGGYVYADEEKDSFLYTWLQIYRKGGDEADAGAVLVDSYLNGATAPENPNIADVGADVVLPTEKLDDGTYDDTFVEAVFAKEYLPSDNMGDINQDGVPDLYVDRFGFDVIDETGKLTGNDLTPLADYNVDEDYFPNTMTAASASLIPGLKETWVMVGRAFTADMEIRGLDEHFNDGPARLGIVGASSDVRYTDPATDKTSTLSDLEYLAFLDWCKRTAVDEAEYDVLTNETGWAMWSPENPTDPTKADTDDDGLPDGYEYYYWYKAHVGYFDIQTENGVVTTNYMRLVGRRYNPADPCNPIAISSEEIETLYNPTVKNVKLAEADTDGDGIPDLVEFEIGTNPFDYDTDGDGLPDGYEIAITKTDPLKAATDDKSADEGLNPDGDVMAMIELSMTPLQYEETEGENTVTNTLWAMGGAELDADGKLTAAVSLYETWKYTMDGGLALGRCVYDANNTKQAEAVLALTFVGKGESATVKALHYQVFALAGFDPRTAWTTSPTIMVNSEKYTNWDEFMLMAFFVHTGGLTIEAAERPSDEVIKAWVDNTTHPLEPDTDGDLMPDGWELYVMGGPGVMEGLKPDDPYSPLKEIGGAMIVRDIDKDALTWPEEYSGSQSSAVHGWTPLYPAWRNKKWPTNPWNSDTDGDGMLDGIEGGLLNELIEPGSTDEWESKTVKANFFYNDTGMAGGGLNPLSVDTDLDGLPDPWETQFHGTFKAGAETTQDTQVIGGGTNVTERTVRTGTVWNMDGMDGTVSDARLDYDADGLSNWQEYMTGAMRCWRYDDAESRWDMNSVSLTEIFNLTPNGTDWNDFWSAILLDREGPDFNPHLVNGSFDPGLSYFTLCKNSFDPAVGGWYMYRDGIDHDLKYDALSLGINRFFKYAANPFSWENGCPYSLGAIYPLQYISCDPRQSDSDHDGMDDYYELFHGMNPLLGEPGVTCQTMGGVFRACDLVYNAYVNPPEGYLVADGAITAVNNWWRNGDTPHDTVRAASVKKLSQSYDFVTYPWLNGIAGADPDGDNIGNQEEAILPKVQAASTYHHTDPTPLWMTDTSYAESLTRRYYRLATQSYDEDASSWFWFLDNDEFVGPDGTVYHLGDFDGFTWDPIFGVLEFSYDIDYWVVGDGWAFSFEENEGYDSDHDFLSDFEEGQGKTKSASDPQDSDDPLRRQAMYFNGKDAFLQTPIRESEQVVNEPSASEARQNFLYYTVECWAKADAESLEGQALRTLVERAIWTGPSGAADERYLRKNFLIGVKNGRWYTRFDTTGADTGKYVEIADGPEATTDWTHIAATYDGTALRLYVNGVCDHVHETSVQPEHGVNALAVDAAGEMHPDGGTLRHGDLISILVGASVKDNGKWNGIVYDRAWRYRNWQNVSPDNPMGLAGQTTFADYDSFFKGYVDEVRIWDGARSKDEIGSDYEKRVRYTTKEALENREAVWEKWRLGALRSPVSEEQLPPQLMYHFTFDHLTGAINPEDVCKVPAGFDTAKTVTDAAAKWSRPDDWKEQRWDNTAVRSTVYSDTTWVPWINNTVAHLPRFDLTTLDSVYWSEDYAGASKASAYGYASFAFPRTHEVFSRWTQQTYVYNGYYDSHFDPDFAEWNANAPILISPSGTVPLTGGWIQKTRWDALFEYSEGTNDVFTFEGEYAEALLRLRFAARDRVTVGDDLLPMGGAYPRRISTAEGGMWDDGSAGDPWAQTGKDSDNNSLPDWWEAYARAHYAKNLRPREPLAWDAVVDYYGVKMPASEAYIRDLAKGLVKNGSDVGYDNAYIDSRDNDKDGMPDWWEQLCGIDTQNVTDGAADPDGDGLSNYAEYLISEVFRFAKCDPKHEKTDGVCVDRFLKVGELYLGEIFTDHDQMDDATETEIGFNRNVYDADKDLDGNGWSNYADYRSYMDKSTWIQVGTESNEVTGVVKPIMAWAGKPTPKVTAKLTYNGSQEIDSFVIKAWKDADMLTQPDATWTVSASNAVIKGNTWICTLAAPDTGMLKEGLNVFVAYAGTDAYEAGAPYAFVRDVDVGWNSASFDLELTDTSPVFARLKLADGTNDRDVLYGQDSGNVVTNDAATALSGGRIDHIRIVPYSITCWAFERADKADSFEPLLKYSYDLASRVVAEFDVDSSVHPFVTEADILKDGAYDIDWAAFDTEAFSMHSALKASNVKDITAVRYRVVVGADGPVSLKKWGDTNTVVRAYSTMIERRFESSTARTIPSALELVGGGILYGGRPTFKWRLDESETVQDNLKSSALFGSSYTAFRIQIADATTGKAVYDSGVCRAPTKDAEGYFSWTAPVLAGSQTDLGKVFSRLGNWKWRVAMYNAKFKPVTLPFLEASNGWSAYSNFSTAVGAQQDVDDHGYGAIDVAVKYAGPEAVLTQNTGTADSHGMVRVQAYENPDFAGVPAAETFVECLSTVSDTSDPRVNVRLHGLKPGTYYVRAYIDTDGDHAKGVWESWGQPKAAVTVAANGLLPSTSLYIEDADTDGDWLPDAWEYITDGYTVGVSDATVDPEGKIVLKTTTYNSMTNNVANISTYASGASLTLFQNLEAAKLLLGLGSDTKEETLSTIRQAIARRIDPNSVRVTSLTVFDGKVVMTVGGKLTDMTGSNVLSTLYTVPSYATVLIKVEKKDSLVDAEWKQVKNAARADGYYEKQIDDSHDATIEIEIPDVDFKSGFYRVSVIQDK